jgi:WD40 repeat protein
VSKLLFLKEYIEMAIKENPSRSSQFKGVTTSATSRRSTVRRQSTTSFRSSAPMSLDSLLDLFSYQTLMTLADHHVHSLYVPHEKFSLQRSIPDSMRAAVAEADFRTKDVSWVKCMYGIDIQQGGMASGHYYDSEPAASAQIRPSGVALTPPNQQVLRRQTTRMSAALQQLDGGGSMGGALSADPAVMLKAGEVSLHELNDIRRKIKALNIPPLSPDFGSLVQPSDGRPYSIFVEPLDVSHSGDGQSGQMWRPKENTVVSTMFEHTGAVNRIAIAQDQSFFVSASSDGTAKVWQVKGTERNAFPRSAVTYTKHTGRVVDAAIIENSHSVATCSDTGAVHVWRVDLGSVGGKRAHANYSPAQQPADTTPPPSTRQASSSSTVWGSSTIKTLAYDEGPVLAVQHFTGDVASVLTFVSRKGMVHGWDLRCSQEAFLYNVRPELGYPMSMVCSPDRNWVCVGTSQGYIGLWDIRYNVMCKLWRHSSASAVHRLACAKSSPNIQSTREGVLASSEGAYMFAAAGNNEAAVWGIPEGGECLKCFRSVSMSAARGAMAALPYLHDIAIPSHPLAPFSGTHVQYVNRSSIDTFASAVRALVGRVSYSSASYLVTAGTDRSIRYWDFTTPSRCFTVSGLEAAQPKPVYETPPSPALRGKLFICYDSAVPSVKATLQSQLPLREYRGTLPPVANYKVSCDARVLVDISQIFAYLPACLLLTGRHIGPQNNRLAHQNDGFSSKGWRDQVMAIRSKYWGRVMPVS